MPRLISLCVLVRRGLPGLLRVRFQVGLISVDEIRRAFLKACALPAPLRAQILLVFYEELRLATADHRWLDALEAALALARANCSEDTIRRCVLALLSGRWLCCLQELCVWGRYEAVRVITDLRPGLISAVDPFTRYRFRHSYIFRSICVPSHNGIDGTPLWRFNECIPWLHARACELGNPEPWPRRLVAEWRGQLRTLTLPPGDTRCISHERQVLETWFDGVLRWSCPRSAWISAVVRAPRSALGPIEARGPAADR